MGFGKPFQAGKSGNPGGRPQITKTIKDAGFDPNSLRAEVIQILVNGMRTLDPADPKEAPSWKFCVDRIDIRINGPVKEFIHTEEAAELTDEEYQAECAAIAREHVAALSPEEKMRLLSGAASETVQ